MQILSCAPLLLQYTFLIQFSINIDVNALWRLPPPPAHISLSILINIDVHPLWRLPPPLHIIQLWINIDANQAFASRNQLFLRKYKFLHHRISYYEGNTSCSITEPIIPKEIQAVASQHKLLQKEVQALTTENKLFP